MNNIKGSLTRNTVDNQLLLFCNLKINKQPSLGFISPRQFPLWSDEPPYVRSNEMIECSGYRCYKILMN